ncbi:caspase-1-like isoform X2 [Onthophagus taurus]|uniref:caspase-1-like isoform X2 n=1 Tax=Onthophagus taurus TaxID=166361 RepID=UPI000C20103A|nr:caspase-1-like isoform X2 [Onthophagus taurus]
MASETVCNGNSTETKYHNGKAVDENDALGNTRFPTAQFTAPMATDRNEHYYRMTHEKRGVAVILNHEHFSAQGMKLRTGTKVDCENLAAELKRLHFDVEVYHDLEYTKVISQIGNLAKRDHSKNDCFIMVVLSHGERDVIYAKDHFYKVETLWNAFTADKVPSLAGKPKLFFIQACQGDQLDPGVTLQRTETDGVACSYRIPAHADFLIAYSTIPGFFSWRNITEGSWFIQSLIEELKINGFTHDILTIMTMVSQRVAINYESNTPHMLSMHSQKQIPCVVSMLTRLVKFTKK